MKLSSLLILVVFSLSSPAYSSGKDMLLPLLTSHDKNENLIKITNNGECPIYKLEMWTLPPNSTFIQRVTRNASFKLDVGTLEKNGQKTIQFRDLINSDGKRLDDNYVIGSIRFKGSYCGDTLQANTDM